MKTEQQINYGSLVFEEGLYPVVYTVNQDRTKAFKPQYLRGKDLTEPQIKYLFETGYFNNIHTILPEEEENELPKEFIDYLKEAWENIKIEGEVKTFSSYGGSCFVIFKNNRCYRLNIGLYKSEVTLD